MSEPIVIQKTPDASKTYEFDWEDAVSDPIVTSTWTVPVAVTNVSDWIAVGGASTLITLAAGVDGTNYTLTDAVTYTSGQTETRTIILEVRARVTTVSLLIVTPGAATSNSYIALVGADTYFANRPFSDDWFDAETILREQALIQATLKLDQYDYIGIPVTVLDTDIEEGYSESATPQALKWPRVANTDGDLIRNYASNAIPTPILNATCELALSIIQSSGLAVSSGTVSEMQIGKSVNIKYASSADSDVSTATIDYTGLPITAARMLKGLRLYSVTG